MTEAERQLEREIDELLAVEMPQPKRRTKIEPAVIRPGVPDAVYHADQESVGVGGLSLMRKSPLHYWWEHRRPGRSLDEPTDEMIFGSAVHTLILEPTKFSERFVERPGSIKVRRGAEWEAFAATLGDRREMKADRMADAVRIAASVQSNPLAASLLTGDGAREASVYWTDPATGVRCRMRPDFAPEKRPILVDLKCTQDAGESAIARTAVNLYWPMRAAWYVDGWKALTGERREYYFAVWESAEPFAFAAYYLDDDALAIGRAEYSHLLERYAECMASGRWPGYHLGLQQIILPSWYRSDS